MFDIICTNAWNAPTLSWPGRSGRGRFPTMIGSECLSSVDLNNTIISNSMSHQNWVFSYCGAQVGREIQTVVKDHEPNLVYQNVRITIGRRSDF